MRSKQTIVSVSACLLLALSMLAKAHTRSESYSHWYLAGNSVTSVVTIPLREVMMLYDFRRGNCACS